MKQLIMVLPVAMEGVLWGYSMESAGNHGGVRDTISYRWSTLRWLIDNINRSAERRAQHLMVRTGSPG